MSEGIGQFIPLILIFIILEFECSPSVKIGICQLSHDLELIPNSISAPANKALVTCSPELKRTSSSLLLKFSEIVLDDDKLEDFQKFLIYNHSAGIGDAAPEGHVRAAIASRINVHANGNSGCRLKITNTLIEMLNKGVTPFVCQKGSVGACGDLAPMSQIALVLLGEGKAYYNGELLDGKKAMESAGIEIPGLKARDGLAVINGSNLLTSMSAIYIYRLRKRCSQSSNYSFITKSQNQKEKRNKNSCNKCCQRYQQIRCKK